MSGLVNFVCDVCRWVGVLRWGFSGAAEFAMGCSNGKTSWASDRAKKAAIEANTYHLRCLERTM